ncbi:MAG: sterol desaturase family protein [Salinisphaeraceae bacterium]|nr:sterol desaturase family protein [Salinisphaeraceae bacterium]
MQELLTLLNNYLAGDPDWKQILLIGMTPFFIIALAIEYMVMRRRHTAEALGKDFYWKDMLANVSLGGTYQIAEVVYYTLFIGAIFAAIYQFRLFDIEMNWVTWPLLMLGLEFFYYWFHRASHRIRWFWCAHVVHHSGEHMNMTTAMRQSLTYTLNLSHLFWVPLMIIGFPPAAVMLALAINLAYQYFIHTKSIGKLHPVIEWIFNTPSHHRVHHGRNEKYIDKNYGGVVIFWDRLFGTFQAEEDNEPVIYGIPKQVKSYNFITLNTHEWVDMFRAAARPGPLWQRIKHLWAPPEWERPEAEGQDRQDKPVAAEA